ncbi:hypothetical protein RO21_07185 [[Actinobacillus] muris]|uniref:Uncharacterized protein n=1 Tax=Muribacter muris TaxID=67855 RepID=A0A0J5S364_9PAST|nr:hypothetical protein [Muribacter muris]KMK51242.1 hypothetical protein RO21_07185 [[Actinobacillus] muris] [Muribacter muris]
MRNQPHQIDLLKSQIKRLWQPATLINVLHTRTDLDSLETCEIQDALKGIGSLLEHQINDIEERLAFILGEEVNNG